MTDTWTYHSQPPRPGWGIRVPAMKASTTRRAIGTAPLPSRAVLPVPADAAVAVRPGDRVLTGQVVARDASGLARHATVTGRVVAVESHFVVAPSPRRATCVVIERHDDDAEETLVPVDALRLAPAELRRRLLESGIVGLGGAMFPTAIKLDPGAPIRALLIDGAECEPWISCDEMLLRERAATVLEGARIMMRALETTHAVIAIESDMPEARVAIHDALGAAADERIGLAIVTAKYPAGGERQLIELIAGAEVPSGGLPRDVGYVCQNVGTAAAVADHFRTGRPLLSRIVTVAGGAVREPGNFEVRIGTSVAELLAAAGGCQREPARLLMGGPMMGHALPDDATPVTAATNCIVAALAAELAPARPEMPCIRCGDCVEACPARLLPHELFHAARQSDRGRLRALGLADCIECGCCDYVCPSSIALVSRFVQAKAQ